VTWNGNSLASKFTHTYGISATYILAHNGRWGNSPTMNPLETIPWSRIVETRILRTECHFERPTERRMTLYIGCSPLTAKNLPNKYFREATSRANLPKRLREFDLIIAYSPSRVYSRIFVNLEFAIWTRQIIIMLTILCKTSRILWNLKIYDILNNKSHQHFRLIQRKYII